MTFQGFFPEFPGDVLAVSEEIFGRVFPGIPLDDWNRKGTWIEHWHDGERIAFAPHKTYCSIYFRGRKGTALYRAIGGTCPVGAVCINLPFDLDWDPEPVRFVVSEILGRET